MLTIFLGEIYFLEYEKSVFFLIISICFHIILIIIFNKNVRVIVQQKYFNAYSVVIDICEISTYNVFDLWI